MVPVIIISWLLFSLAEMHSAVAQQSRCGLYLTVRNGTSGPLCITDVPSSKLTMRSFLQCAAQCRNVAGCNDFNFIDIESGGRIECQLFIAKDLLHYGTQHNCTAYQVTI